MFLCLRVLHQEVSVKRLLTFVAVVAVATHITSKSLYVHHADMARLLAYESFLGARKLTVQKLDYFSCILLGKNGGKGLKNLLEENLEKMHKIVR